MSYTKYNNKGGSVSILPIMDGGMNCGYSIDAYVVPSTQPFLSVSGTKDHPKPLVFHDASLIPEKTVVMATFHFRAGTQALVGTPYTIGIHGKQDDHDLKERSIREGRLTEEVKVSQTSTILISETMLQLLIS